jgi:bifunctional DNase/RNase
MQRMKVVAVGLDELERPLLLLQEAAGRRRVLPVWIGQAEASAIAAEQLHLVGPRPRTHALIAGVIIACGRHLRHVSITALRENTFFAELVLNRGTRISARVSDAVALALHLGAPIRAEESVLEQAGLTETDVYTLEPEPAGDGRDAGGIEDWEIQRLRQFLDTASADDFDLS